MWGWILAGAITLIYAAVTIGSMLSKRRAGLEIANPVADIAKVVAIAVAAGRDSLS